MSDHPGEHKPEATIKWWGHSKDVVSRFPDQVKQNLGYSLRLLQWGEEPHDYRPLPSVGKGLYELRDQDKDGWYRVIYLSRTDGVIHVVHAFEKNTRAMPESEKEVARRNLKHVREYIQEQRQHAKREK
jgi:phage-related protein